MMQATMHDGQTIEVEVRGTGPNLLLPVNPIPVEGPKAEEMRMWGVDPALGRTLIDGLSSRYRVIAFDYEGHVMSAPKPDTLTPANVAGDLLAVADSAGAAQFAYYGYSWLALSGLQLAIRTTRLTGLIMGGFPPLDGPYKEMLRVTTATHEMSGFARKPANDTPTPTSDDFDWSAVEVTASESQTKQFVTLYEALQSFDDRAAQADFGCPRLCFAGSADRIDYGSRWGDVQVDIVGPLLNRRAELEAFGWDVRVLDGLDHTQAMQAANVLPIILPWLEAKC